MHCLDFIERIFQDDYALKIEARSQKIYHLRTGPRLPGRDDMFNDGYWDDDQMIDLFEKVVYGRQNAVL